MSDYFTMDAVVGTTEVELKPDGASSGMVPYEHSERKVYGYFINEQSGATNTLTFRIYNGTEVEKEFSIVLSAYATLDERNEKVPWLIVLSGRTVKAVASSDSVYVRLICRDEP